MLGLPPLPMEGPGHPGGGAGVGVPGAHGLGANNMAMGGGPEGGFNAGGAPPYGGTYPGMPCAGGQAMPLPVPHPGQPMPLPGAQGMAQPLTMVAPANAFTGESARYPWYRVSFMGGLDLRQGPHVEAPRTGETLCLNATFASCEELMGADGRVYLRLADGRGWAFDDSALFPTDPSVVRGYWSPVGPSTPENPAAVQSYQPPLSMPPTPGTPAPHAGGPEALAPSPPHHGGGMAVAPVMGTGPMAPRSAQ